MLTQAAQPRIQGFVLLEALIAITIFSFALLGLVGMQALSIRNSADAKYRADAAYFANQMVAQMWVDRANLTAANYNYRNAETSCGVSTTAPSNTNVTNWLADMAAVLPGVSTGNTSSQKPKIIVDTSPLTSKMVTITICWKSPNETQTHNHVTTAQINN